MPLPDGHRRWFNGIGSVNRHFDWDSPRGCNYEEPPALRTLPAGDAAPDRLAGAPPRDYKLMPVAGTFAVDIAADCPAQLLAALQPGDVLELVPDSGPLEPAAVRIEFGIFQVGTVLPPQCQLFWRLLTKGFDVVGRVVCIQAQPQSAPKLWVAAYLVM